MNAAQLIELLRTFPADTPVGYVNDCADDGSRFVPIDSARVTAPDNWHLRQCPDGLPESGAVVLE